ncbi:hypothetical protein [Devosia sp.]|uniref:hypothetical protein n=1 Tax=Devosia sp. TaxID=1871048 RepID=UPI003267D6DD
MPALAIAQSQLPLDDTDLPALIVLGRDDANKAHASWFDQTEAVQARAAAGLMGMMSLVVSGTEVQALADKLPHGKIFGSGKAFVPFVKGDLYDQLIAHVPVSEQVRPLRVVRAQAEGDETNSATTEPKAADKAPPATMPADWSKIIPGSIVLVTEDRAEGWYEAVVVKANPQDMFEVKWLHYPELAHLNRHRTHLALLHPAGSPQG